MVWRRRSRKWARGLMKERRGDTERGKGVIRYRKRGEGERKKRKERNDEGI